MRKQAKQLPHISRFITEPLEKLSEEQKKLIIKWFPFGLIALYLLFSTFYPSTAFDRAKNGQNHLKLAKIYKNYNDLIMARSEIEAAKQINSDDDKINQEMQSINYLISLPGVLEKKLAYWTDIINKRPGFRDAYVQKFLLSYQLKKTADLKDDLYNIFLLDPNMEEMELWKKLAEN